MRARYCLKALRVEHGSIDLLWATMATKGKERAAMFTATEQRFLLETYEEFKDVITKKGNRAAINKAREKGWQEIADRLNA